MDAAVATLSKVRGPAMKFGQVIAVFTSALPPEIATRFAALERLYESAEPLPFSKVAHLLEVVPARSAHRHPRRRSPPRRWARCTGGCGPVTTACRGTSR